MKREYRKMYYEIKKVKDIENLDIRGIYIIPYKAYNGFWGKNGYKSYDFIVETLTDKKWFHWEGDVIQLISSDRYDLNIDCSVGDDYIRIFSTRGIMLQDLEISTMTIRTKN